MKYFPPVYTLELMGFKISANYSYPEVCLGEITLELDIDNDMPLEENIFFKSEFSNIVNYFRNYNELIEIYEILDYYTKADVNAEIYQLNYTYIDLEDGFVHMYYWTTGSRTNSIHFRLENFMSFLKQVTDLLDNQKSLFHFQLSASLYFSSSFVASSTPSPLPSSTGPSSPPRLEGAS